MLAISWLDVETGVRITPRVLATLPWGDEPGAVGRAEVGERVIGPRSFAVADDKIFVADTFGYRILVLDRDGAVAAAWDLASLDLAGDDGAGDETLARVLPGVVAAATGGPRLVPWVNDIAVGPDGHIYLADAAIPRIIVLSPEGELDRVIDLPASAPNAGEAGDVVWLTERLLIDDDGVLYLTHAYLTDTALSRRVTRFQESTGKFAHISSVTLQRHGGTTLEAESLLPVPANSFVVAPNGHLYVEAAGSNPFTRVVRAYDNNIRLTHSWQVSWPELLDGASLVGVDRSQWVYLALGTGQAGGKMLLLAPNQGTIYEAPVAWQSGYEANIYARLHGDNIFIAVPGPSGFTLEQWPVQRFRRLVPATARSR